MAEKEVTKLQKSQFHANGVIWQLEDRFQNYGFFSGLMQNPTGKPIQMWDTANITNDGSIEIIPITLGLEGSLLNRNKAEIYARYQRGCEKLKTDQDRKLRLTNEANELQRLEQKRLDFLHEGEALKFHLLEEIKGLYDKSDSYSALAKNKRVQECLLQISTFDSWKFYNRHVITSL